jgi:hypothetical protein
VRSIHRACQSRYDLGDLFFGTFELRLAELYEIRCTLDLFSQFIDGNECCAGWTRTPLEVCIGRRDKPTDFHETMVGGYDYFDHYLAHQPVHLTLDKRMVYEVKEICRAHR